MFKSLFYSSLGYIGVGSLLLEVIECLAALPRLVMLSSKTVFAWENYQL
jgi:hypothetical protein